MENELDLDLALTEIDVAVSSFYEDLAIYATLFSLAIGLLHLFFARKSFAFHGLQARHSMPEAVGESRTLYASVIIALSSVTFIFQQSVLFQALGLAWGLCGAMFVFSFIVAPKSLNWFKALCALFGIFFFVLVYYNWGMPIGEYFMTREAVPFGENIILSLVVWFILLSVGIALIFPNFILNALGIKSIFQTKNKLQRFGVGLGQLSLVLGFNFSLGLFAYLFLGQLLSAKLFLALGLILSFILSFLGRILIIFVDKGRTQYQFIYLIFEGLMVTLVGNLLFFAMN